MGPLLPLRPNQVYFHLSHFFVHHSTPFTELKKNGMNNTAVLHTIQKFDIPALRMISYVYMSLNPPSTGVLDCVWSFSKEDVEKCKQKDLLEQTMSEMIGEFPALHQTIVAERDIYLTHTLRQATRCVEAPHNSQSNYRNNLSLYPSRWRFYLCWCVFIYVLSSHL